jgi:hypothetical protein
MLGSSPDVVSSAQGTPGNNWQNNGDDEDDNEDDNEDDEDDEGGMTSGGNAAPPAGFSCSPPQVAKFFPEDNQWTCMTPGAGGDEDDR